MSVAIDLIDHLARTLQRHHEGVQLQMKGLLGECLDRADAHTPAARSDLRQSIRTLRIQASEDLAPLTGGPLRAAADQVFDQAVEDAGLELNAVAKEALNRLIDESIETAVMKVRDSLRLDEETILALHRTVQLRASMRATTGVSARLAFSMVRAGVLSTLKMTRIDRAGKRWDGTIYTRTAMRAMLVAIYSETFLMALLSNGTKNASIEVEGVSLVFDILIGYERIQALHLHPNTTVLVTHA